MPISSLVIGVLSAGFISWLGYRAQALDRNGALAATLIGAMVFGFGGWGAALLIVFFFVSSSAFTRFMARRKGDIQQLFEKGGRRDARQVFANGAVAASFALLFWCSRSEGALVGIVGAIAAATADTWGTELGLLSRQKPQSILTGETVPYGTSGGVTTLGSGASVLGALAIGLAGLTLMNDWRVIPLGLIGGVFGAMLDSVLGARWQAMYTCPACERVTESHPTHHCGSATAYRRGLRWLNNDAVNFLSTAGGAGICVGIAHLWG